MNSTNQTNPDHTELPEKPPVVIITNSARFTVGQLAATPGALALLEQHNIGVAALVNRHIHGSWGDICADDAHTNELAIEHGNRVMSVYRLVDAQRLALTPVAKRNDLPTVWVITESDRSVTTLLLPSEY
jgi:hypothetical protein